MASKKLSGSYWYTTGFPPATHAETGRVTFCLLRDNDLVIDYQDNSENFHIKATTTNNLNYKGKYNSLQGSEHGYVGLIHYSNGNKHLFYGKWASDDEEGTCLFDLEEIND